MSIDKKIKRDSVGEYAKKLGRAVGRIEWMIRSFDEGRLTDAKRIIEELRDLLNVLDAEPTK